MDSYRILIEFTESNIYWIAPLFTILITLNVAYIFYAVGSLMSARHVVVRSVKLNQPVAVVWKAITDQESYPDWQRHVRGCLSQNEEWIETSLFGSTTFKIAEMTAEKLWVRQSTHINLKWWITLFLGSNAIESTTWTFEMYPSGDAAQECILHVSKDSHVGSPAFRLLWALALGVGSDVEQYLNDLHRFVDPENTQFRIHKPIHGKLPF